MKPMKRLTSPLIFFILSALLAFSCKVKDRKQESTANTNSKKQSVAWLLAGDESKGWAIQSFTVNGEDQLKSLEPCQLDNIDYYFRNLVFESKEGLARCNANDPDILRRGKWSLNTDSTTVEVKLGTDLFSLTIVELTEDTFHYRSEIGKNVTEARLVSAGSGPAISTQPETK
jgi:hypothetical protein